MLNRRQFVGQTAAVSAVAPFLMGAQGSKPPNILFIMSDEHDGAILSCMGDKIIRTPHIDSIAENGILFRSCYTPSPVCGPARLALTAGKTVGRSQVWSNHNVLESDDVYSMAKAFSNAGYQSILCGKQHYTKERRYGFTQLGRDFNHFEKAGFVPRRHPLDHNINVALRDKRFERFGPSRKSGIYKHDEPITHEAVQFFKEHSADDPPFFLFVGYMAPHFPLRCPPKYFRRYRDKVPMPNIPAGHIESQPLNYQHLRKGFGVVEQDPAMVKLGRECYYGLINWLDDEIGDLLKALRRSSAADNTIVVFTSDHGENKGDHYLWWKNCMYESAVRIPMLMSFPQRFAGGQVRDGACTTLDVLQTLMELSGAEPGEDWQGDSMVAHLDDPNHPWKDRALSEYYAHNVCSGFQMLRQGPWKYVYHTRFNDEFGPERELYNLETDPNEFKNLAAIETERVKSMHAELTTELGMPPDDVEALCRADYIAVAGEDWCTKPS
ncbi:MAG: sulfatase-like hydrolase/transferase [Myxococcota bacterium]|nr:sulfatase-like hydrolase/transferase [Myxococcota bacterium]